MAVSVRESCEFIANSAKDVKINSSKVDSVADLILEAHKQGKISLSNFSECEVHPKSNDSLGIDWIFTVDTLNFCFWNPRAAHWEVTWNKKKYSGYYALCAAIWRSIEEGVDLRDPKVYSKLSLSQLKHIFRCDEGSGELLLVEERLECLHEVGKILLDKYEGTFKSCVQKSQNSAQKLLDLVVSEFRCYQDEAVFKGRKVSFYKRAQILVADIWLWCKDEGMGHFPDIDSITMFADYRVPQVLVHFGVLEYSPELYETLKKNTILKSKCDIEIEIRGCSIEAVEQISRAVRSKVGGSTIKLNSILIDNFLWDYRRAHAKELEYIPYHKVISIFY
ncbi:unnamed protein product [Bemisia tabaci]|uniref:Queuosine 5'-phosphate N-glycosylase/hydrolase n=1 Tax=Bemisia tabaci TaxID=7038 RepID=A0A9P0AD03_BEMTA|nr:unnamed protein product [Bemisia tabaci]